MGLDPEIIILIPCGPHSGDNAIEAAESVEAYSRIPYEIVFVDDCTEDGTYEKLFSQKRHCWHIVRSRKRNKYARLVQTLSLGYRYINRSLSGRCILKMDTDALVTGHGIFKEALAFMDANRSVGMYGVFRTDFNRKRSFATHANQINAETTLWRRVLHRAPSWLDLLRRAESNGYKRGENVFGGAYFITRKCLQAIDKLGGLDVPYNWHSRLAEDVYFSMATVAAGYTLGHFAAPEGPLCMEHRGLPYPAREIVARGYKITHSVDNGPNTGPVENDGVSAREAFRDIRKQVKDEFGSGRSM